MKTLRILAVALLAATSFAPAAFAGDRASDTQYVAAERCLAIAKVAGADTAGVEAFLKAQRVGRQDFVVDRARAARREAQRAYRQADGAERGQIAGGCDHFATRLAASSTSNAR
ncbi:MAG TPA: hypothetical protein VF699_01575 [Caulobacteraceae bacterium]|jgi:hypothetical protein